MTIIHPPVADAHVRWYGGVHVGVGPFWWSYPYPWIKVPVSR